MTSENKMYNIAKHYNELNDKGNVKASKANEKGYARIKDITRGCTLVVVHRKDSQIIINLLVTTAAKKREETLCNRTIEVFKSHFGSAVKYNKRLDLRGSDDVRDSYFVDVTNKNLSAVLNMVDEVKSKLVICVTQKCPTRPRAMNSAHLPRR